MSEPGPERDGGLRNAGGLTGRRSGRFPSVGPPGPLVEPVDPGDEEALATWFGPLHEAYRHDWPAEEAPRLRQMTAFTRPNDYSDSVLALVRGRSGAPVGALWVSLPKKFNPTIAEITLAVRPNTRRAGVGSALLAHAAAVSLEHERTRLIASTYEGDRDRSPGARFARASSFELARREVRLELRFPLRREVIDRAVAAADAARTDFRIEWWVGDCPDRFLEDRVELATVLGVDTPRGGLGREPGEWSTERLRRRERGLKVLGLVPITAGAVDSSGRLIAYSELVVDTAAPEVAHQYGSVVLPQYRGRRLATVLKLANLMVLRKRSPQTMRVVTNVDRANKAMLHSNAALDFVSFGSLCAWQKDIGR